MKIVLKKYTIFAVMALVPFFCAAECTPLELAELTGKRIEIHGPYYLDYIGIARDEATCEMLGAISHSDNMALINKVLNGFGIMLIRNNTPAMVLEVKPTENKAKVYIFSGLYKGASGWIPFEWLRGNRSPVRFSDTPF